LTTKDTGSNTSYIKVGSNDSYVARGFVTFDITKLPQGARVEKAILRLYQVKITGKPLVELGNLMIDHLTYGDSIDLTDYGIPALVSGISTLSTDLKEGWKEADVSKAVREDVANKRSTSQLRLRFTKEVKTDDSAGNFIYFESANEYKKATQNLPELVIEYY
jgi:hypothetical protein